MDATHPRKMEGVEQMSQQCGNCKWWDRSMIAEMPNGKPPVSYCDKIELLTSQTTGTNCQFYEGAQRMRGISEESLKDRLDIASRLNDHVRCQLLYELLDECKEINPWLPIDENTPKDKELLLLFPKTDYDEKEVISGTYKTVLSTHTSLRIPTHYQELPDDPV